MRLTWIGVVGLVACTTEKGTLNVNNDAPELSILAPLDGTEFSEYDVIEFQGRTTDLEDDAPDLTVMWTSSIDGLLDTTPADAEGNLYFAATLNPGEHVITLSVTDTQGLTSNAAAQLIIIDQEDNPTIELRSPEQTSAEEGVDVEFEVYVNDIQDAATDLTVQFSSSLDGEICAPIPDEIGIASCSASLSIGMHEMRFVVTDTHGNTGETLQLFSILSSSDVDNDGDGYSEDDGDCNDDNEAISPGATESLNGLDDDCNDLVDDTTEGFDDDGDGFSELTGDCNDQDPAIHPDAIEECDGVDQDCDTVIDNDTECFDDDGDGYSENDGDCDDTQLAASPVGTELTDGIDNDCDGDIDEGSDYFDDDGDCYCEQLPCYGSVNTICNPTALVAGDCNDADATIAPGATEVCDGVDQDCDGTPDNNPINPQTWYADSDGDGYGDLTATLEACDQPLGYVGNSLDCDDVDPSTSPIGLESCDTFDNDCDGVIDEAASIDAPDWYLDNDSDSYGDASVSQRSCSQPAGYVSNADDCLDSDPAVFPGAAEVCNGSDDNCDGVADEIGATGGLMYYPDDDGDTYGDMYATPVAACGQPTGYVYDSTDCDDNDNDIYPGAVETCDYEDNDCDSIVDNNTVDGFTFYTDNDGDGFGDPATIAMDCSVPAGAVTQSGDCDDSNNTIYSGAAELCDGLDNNCDGTLDDGLSLLDFWVDSDGDTWGDAAQPVVQACAAPAGMTDIDGDCDDSDGAVSPDAQEQCLDGIDNDCSGDSDCDDWSACRDIEATCWVCGDGYQDVNETCDDGNQISGDGCDSTCQSEMDLSGVYASWSSEGRMVHVFQSVSNTSLSNYTTFCEDRGLEWFVPLSQSDAQKVITDCYNFDTYHTWIITYNNTSSGVWGGYSVVTDSTGSGWSSSGFSAIRKWSSSYCDPEQYDQTNCWDSDHSYDWLICEEP